MVHILQKSLSNCYKANNKCNRKSSLENSRKKSIVKGSSRQAKVNMNEQLSQNNFKQLKEKNNKNKRSNTNSNRGIRNFKPAINKIANKYMTSESRRAKHEANIQQKCFKFINQVPYEYKIANKLRLAVKESECQKPWKNINLRQLVIKGLQKGITWKSIESILYECKIKQKMDNNCHLLEICYEDKIFLVLNVRSENITKFKKQLMQHTLKKHRAKYDSVLQYFDYHSKIEALASYGTTKQFDEFESRLAKDAINCRAYAVEIHDYETGAVTFQSHPYTLATMTHELEQNGYKVLYADYGLKSLKQIPLAAKDEKEYLKFLNDLEKYSEIENYNDNLKRKNKQANSNDNKENTSDA